MNLPSEYLYAYIDAPAHGPSMDHAKPVVIGDLDTREPSQKEETGAIVLSLI